MLLDYLTDKNLYSCSVIEETLDILNLKIGTMEPMTSVVKKLFDELKTISTRDTFELFFTINGNDISISDCSMMSFDKISTHISEHEDEDDYELNLTIQKIIEKNTISIYFLDEFSEYLKNENTYNLIKSISDHFIENLNFEIFSSIKSFGSNTIRFSSTTEIENNENEDITDRTNQLEILFDNSSITNLPPKMLPCDFNLTSNSSNENINVCFEKLCSVLSLIFLSSSSTLDRKGYLSYKIFGYKSISDKNVTSDTLQKDKTLLYKIYSWAYEGGNSSDKIGLVRNVLSIHLNSDGKIKIDNDVWEAIHSNYQIYLKGNIQSYLEIKNKISEIIIESTTKTYAMADELLDALKNNIFIIVSFIFTVMIVNGLKENGASKVFSNTYLVIVLMFTTLSFLWLYMLNKETLKRFNSASDTVKEILRLNYNNLLMTSEIDRCVDPIVETNRRYLTRQLKRYTKWWLIILSFSCISFIIANRFIPHEEKSLLINSTELIKANNPKVIKKIMSPKQIVQPPS